MLHVWNGSRNRAWMGALIAVLIVAGLFAPGKQVAQGVSITGAFPSFNSTNINVFQLNGSAALSGSAVLLTPNQNTKVGSMFWKNKISLRDNRSFSAQFCISMDTPGGGGADGIVFVIQSQTSSPSSSGGGIGYKDISPSIGIEFDTYANNGGSEDYDPSGDANHIAFVVNGNPRYVDYWDPGWELQSSTTYAWVDYDGIAQKLEVRASTSNSRPSSAILSKSINLGNGSYIPQDVYVGFTAATGGANENQWVRSFYINNDFIDGGINPGTTTYTSSPTTVSVSATPASAAANGSYNIGVTARVLDMNGAAVPSWPVTFSITSGAATLSSTSATTDASGYASVSLASHSPGNVTVRATADGGAYAETTVTFANTAPTASGQSITTTEDTSYSGTLSGSDPDGDTLTFAAISGASHGSVSITNTATGAFTYMPVANYPTGHTNGSDSFTFRVTDAHGTISGTATVTITVTSVNDPPVVTEGASRGVTMDEDGYPTAFALTLHATDADGDAITWSIVTAASHGTAGVNGSTGVVSYAPTANWNGTDTFVVQASDAYGGTASTTVTVTVNPRNDAPVNTVLPVISGTPHPGRTLSVTTGTWDDSIDAPLQGVFSYLYYWQRSSNGGTTWSNINGVTTTGTYVVTAADLGCLVRCVVDCKDTRTGNPPDVVAEATASSVSVTNAAPVVQEGATLPVTMDEDGYPTAFALTLHATDADGDTITWSIVTAASHGTAGVNGSTGVVSYAPTANWNGTDTFVVQASDAYGGTASTTVTITVTPVNDAPSFTKGSNQTVLEDCGTQTIPGWATAITTGPANESGQTLTFTLTASNSALFSGQPSLSPTGTLTFTPAPDANGTATITVTLKDDGGTANGGVDTSATQTFTITVTAVNDVPSFTKGADQTVLEDCGSQTVSTWATTISAGPADESGQTVDFIVTNNNNLLFSTQPSISPAGTLTYTPALNQNGLATVTVQIHDNGGTANGGVDTSNPQTFTITVTAVNDAPTVVVPGTSVTTNEDTQVPVSGVSVTDVDVDETASPGNTVQVTLSVSHGTLSLPTHTGLTFSVGDGTADGTMTFTGTLPDVDAALATLSYLPDKDYNSNWGAESCSVTVSDLGHTGSGGALTDSKSVPITVTPVNDPPTVRLPSPVTLDEDVDTLVSGINVADVDVNETASPNNTVQVTLSVSHGSLSLPTHTGLTFSTGDGAADGTMTFAGTLTDVNTALASLRYRSNLHYNGSDAIEVTCSDLGHTGSGTSPSPVAATLSMTVTSVNDAPSFTKGADQTVLEDCGTQVIPGWATAISAGPPDEAGQTLTFTLTASNTALFSVQPSLSPTGTLTFTPAPDANGTATVTVILKDDGGTANGGVDASASQTFTITVSPVNDMPSFMRGADIAVDEDCKTQTIPGWATAISAGPANEAGQQVAFTVTSDNPGLFAVQPAISPAGTLTFAPAPNRNGVAHLTITLSDDGTRGTTALTTPPQFATLLVNPINDPPVCLRTPAISGKGSVGTLLTADPGSWDDHVDQTPGHVALLIQWLRGKSPVGVDGVPIAGATELTYEVQKQDVGWYLGFQVVAMDDGEGTPRTMQATAYAPVFIRAFEADTVPPVVVMLRDLPAKVAGSSLVLDGLVSDAGSGVRSFSINGTPVILYADGSFHETVSVVTGDNALELTAVDNTGNTWSHTYHVTGVTRGTQQQTRTMVLTVGKKTMTVDGHATVLDAAPLIREGRTMVPFRAIVEGLGGTVSWNAKTRQVTIKVRGQTVVLTVDQHTASVNGHVVSVDPTNARVAPFIGSGRTYIPVRFLTERLGMTVTWNAKTQTVTITWAD